MALGLHAVGGGILISNVFLVFPSSPLLEGPAKELFWQFGWTRGNFSLAQMVRLSCCVKQVKAPFKMLLAVFLSLDNNRFLFFYNILQNCILYDIMFILKTKGPFPTRVISNCDCFNHIVGTLPLKLYMIEGEWNLFFH